MNSIYILTQSYPSEVKKYQMAFIHPRVKAYQKNGFEVKIISFTAKEPYTYDGVKIYDIRSANLELADKKEIIIMAHSPNLRNHLPFINKWDAKIKNLFLFFHGHESLNLAKYYPKPFKFRKKERLSYYVHKLYDPIKIYYLSKFIRQRLHKGNTELIYVSKWFFNEVAKYLSVEYLNNTHVHIINNGLNEFVNEGEYTPKDFYGDFITLRPIDTAKYAIDLVVKFALSHPEYTFHVYGKGEYFKYNPKPKNLKHIDKFFLPHEIPEILNHYRYALMPTYQDTQGVMMCEMVSYGIPTIVSDMEVCHEMLDEYPNVKFIPNNDFDHVITDFPTPLNIKVNRFAYEKTIGQEVSLLKKVMKSDKN